MDWTAWIAPGAAFVGAGLAYYGARAGVRQQAKAAGEAEWGRRFAAALRELSQADDPRRRRLGQVIMQSLVEDDRGSATDRQLADLVLDDDLSPSTAGGAIDDVDISARDRENRGTGSEGGPA